MPEIVVIFIINYENNSILLVYRIYRSILRDFIYLIDSYIRRKIFMDTTNDKQKKECPTKMVKRHQIETIITFFPFFGKPKSYTYSEVMNNPKLRKKAFPCESQRPSA